MLRPGPILSALLVASALGAQSFQDFEIVRRRPTRFASVLKARVGASYVIPQDEDAAAGREEDFSGVGYLLYRAGDFTPSGHQGLTAYAGNDGAFVAYREPVDSGQSMVFEGSTRYVPWYREGFYEGDDWVPTGRYGGFDYGGYVGFSSYVDEDITLEFGPFYRRFEFDRNDTTAPGYVIPEDYNTYGARIHLEHNTLTTDRDTDLPVDGFIFSIRVDYERNDSNQDFGTAIYTSSLPSAVWRGVGHLEWYFPTEGSGAWLFELDGGLADDSDRRWIYDAQKPIGQIFGDAKVGYRLDLGGGLSALPYGNLQYTQTLGERGVGKNDDVWFGGGLDLRWSIGSSFALWAEYSYLNNPNRPSISFTDDIYGEHQMFAGLEVTFGS